MPRSIGMPKKCWIWLPAMSSAGAGGEADDDGVRDEVHQHAHAREAHRELEDAGQERRHQHELDVGGVPGSASVLIVE